MRLVDTAVACALTGVFLLLVVGALGVLTLGEGAAARRAMFVLGGGAGVFLLLAIWLGAASAWGAGA